MVNKREILCLVKKLKERKVGEILEESKRAQEVELNLIKTKLKSSELKKMLEQYNALHERIIRQTHDIIKSFNVPDLKRIINAPRIEDAECGFSEWVLKNSLRSKHDSKQRIEKLEEACSDFEMKILTLGTDSAEVKELVETLKKI